MLRHVVAWTFKDSHEGLDKAAIIDRAAELLNRCETGVPSVRGWELGRATEGYEASHDLILISTFDDAAGLKAYIEHPVHQDVVEFLGKVRDQRVVIDYEI